MLVYPFGATINVVKPAIPILSSGSVAFPVCRPICAFYSIPDKGKIYFFIRYRHLKNPKTQHPAFYIPVIRFTSQPPHSSNLLISHWQIYLLFINGHNPLISTINKLECSKLSFVANYIMCVNLQAIDVVKLLSWVLVICFLTSTYPARKTTSYEK